MEEKRLKEIFAKLPDIRIAVVGALFMDKWLSVDRNLDEPSVETGLTAYQVVGQRTKPGAAGTVLGNLSALGIGSLYAVSLLGEDGHG